MKHNSCACSGCVATLNLDWNGWNRARADRSVWVVGDYGPNRNSTSKFHLERVHCSKTFVPDCTLQTYNCNVLCLTNKRRSHNDSVLVVGQLGYAVGIARRLQVKNILDLLAFVAHRFGSYTQETDTI